MIDKKNSCPDLIHKKRKQIQHKLHDIIFNFDLQTCTENEILLLNKTLENEIDVKNEELTLYSKEREIFYSLVNKLKPKADCFIIDELKLLMHGNEKENITNNSNSSFDENNILLSFKENFVDVVLKEVKLKNDEILDLKKKILKAEMGDKKEKSIVIVEDDVNAKKIRGLNDELEKRNSELVAMGIKERDNYINELKSLGSYYMDRIDGLLKTVEMYKNILIEKDRTIIKQEAECSLNEELINIRDEYLKLCGMIESGNAEKKENRLLKRMNECNGFHCDNKQTESICADNIKGENIKADTKVVHCLDITEEAQLNNHDIVSEDSDFNIQKKLFDQVVGLTKMYESELNKVKALTKEKYDLIQQLRTSTLSTPKQDPVPEYRNLSNHLMEVAELKQKYEDRKNAAMYHKRNAYKNALEIESLKDQITGMKSEIENIRKNNDADNLRSLLRCTACDARYKDTVLLKCMHVFCSECINEKIRARKRNCPNCNENFHTADVKRIFL